LPHLSAAQVHAALTYYFDHQAAINREIRKNEDIDYWERFLKRKTAKAA
jgi:ABC-type transport system involved in cytochrome c biogenesis ATPase subunit